MSIADAIDRVLPQTQCTRCGYAACRPYAEAMASGEAPINRCPPGGAAGIVKLAALLGRETLALDAACGIEQPLRAAVVDESNCIGCTLCIQACPVDAIVGAPKLMHTVVAGLCTGCELCIAPCPVDCISLVPADEWNAARADAARSRFEARNERIANEAKERSERLAERTAAARSAPDFEAKRAAIQAAVERARAARAKVGA
jgi:Na+-translocating ferredoxin:NAD+ oxidoreductase subunit B